MIYKLNVPDLMHYLNYYQKTKYLCTIKDHPLQI